VSRSRAEILGISDGLLWVIGNSDEENALLDPLPEGVTAVSDKPDDEAVSAAIVVLDDDETLAGDLDDALPQLGSIPSVWATFRTDRRELSLEMITNALADYGWSVEAQLDIGAGWSALRLNPN